MTPDEINSMSRDDLVETLEAHGLTLNPDSDKTLEELREMTIQVVFAEI